MIAYFDTSALVPLVIEEPASSAAGAVWDAADSVAVARIAYVETVAALAMALRMGRLDDGSFREARGIFDELWSEIDVIELDRALVDAAADFAHKHGLRGYDAVHSAAAVAVSDTELVAISGDQQLLAAWSSEGLAISDTTRS